MGWLGSQCAISKVDASELSSPKMNMFCAFCTDIDFFMLKTNEGYKHHASFKDLDTSASHGCPSCALQEIIRGSLIEDWVGSSGDGQITLHMSHRGYIDVAQVDRMKSNHQPFFKSIVHLCTTDGK